MNMLVVDDEVDIANMLAEFFRMEGYEVSVAHDGRRPWRRLLLAPPPISCCSM